MKAAALLLLGTVLAAGPARGQDVPVRGGEHRDFTRLVLARPDIGGWSVRPAPGGYEVLLEGGGAFDLSQAFARIPRDRVAGLRPRGEGRLGLDLACDCHAVAFAYPGVGLVLDVRDGPAPPGDLAPGPRGPAAPPLSLPLPAGLPAAPVLTPLLPDLAGAPNPAPDPDAAAADRVARTEALMLEGLATAATEGLLDLAPGGEVRLPGASDGAGRPGLRLRTGAEIDPLAQGPLSADGTACRPDGDFDLAAWSGSGDFAAEIGPRLVALGDARDRIDPEGVEGLARTYLAFGLGREARQVLELDGRASRMRDGLGLIARLVDGDPVPPDAFADQAGCLGAVALWRALARGTLDGVGERERIAASIALRALPEAVRDALSIRLAGLFLDAGDAPGAQALAEISRAEAPEAQLARAEITREVQGPAPALRALERLAERDPRLTPEAMLALLDLSVAQGRPVDEGRLELARALRFENPGPPARALLLAEGRVLAAQDRWAEALDLLAEEQARAPGRDLESALERTVSDLTAALADGPFVDLVLGGLPAGLPARARETAAARLAALGFPDEAARLRAASAGAVPPVAPAKTAVDPAGPETASPQAAPPPAPITAAAPSAIPGAALQAGATPPPEPPPVAAASGPASGSSSTFAAAAMPTEPPEPGPAAMPPPDPTGGPASEVAADLRVPPAAPPAVSPSAPGSLSAAAPTPDGVSGLAAAPAVARFPTSDAAPPVAGLPSVASPVPSGGGPSTLERGPDPAAPPPAAPVVPPVAVIGQAASAPTTNARASADAPWATGPARTPATLAERRDLLARAAAARERAAALLGRPLEGGAP